MRAQDKLCPTTDRCLPERPKLLFGSLVLGVGPVGLVQGGGFLIHGHSVMQGSGLL